MNLWYSKTISNEIIYEYNANKKKHELKTIQIQEACLSAYCSSLCQHLNIPFSSKTLTSVSRVDNSERCQLLHSGWIFDTN